ncbi:MAG: phosphotransferase [Alphaproteobacteria bacterium]|nr:phosphotransferase [Alphaproteobacteria bacterium]
MTIHKFSAVRSRNRIGLVDEDWTPEIPKGIDIDFDALPGYKIYRCSDASLLEPGRLATTAAVIFRQSHKRPRQIANQLERMAPALLQHGCLVFVQPLPVKPDAGTQYLRRFFVEAINALQLPVSGLTEKEFDYLGDWSGDFNATKLTPLVHVLELSDDWQGVLSYLQWHPPGEAFAPGPRVVLCDPDDVEDELDVEHALLVQRAFWDSAEVRLEPLQNGLSGVNAYRAYVHQRVDQVGGQWPFRYFVKIGDRGKVATEFMKYCDLALEHLPYHLGPRLRLDRCALGHQSGIIVSDFVGGAVPLRDCVRGGRAAALIANLFNVTFRAWHNCAAPKDVSLQEYLHQRLLPIPGFRQPLFDKYGATKSLEELSELLLKGDSRPVSMGVIHGDLHATNVMVRGDDAILIDFESVQAEVPVLRDLACLEGGLFVDGFVGDRRDTASILDSVKCLFAPELLLNGRVTSCHPIDGSAWFFDCVMQIRMQARQHELKSGQYALVLASELMHKACNAHNFDTDNRSGAEEHCIRKEQTRAMAYVLAEWILVGLPSFVDMESKQVTQ